MEKYLEILPGNVINKIFVFNSHPVAELFKKSQAYQEYEGCDCGEDVCDCSFVDFYFLDWRSENCCGACMMAWRDCQCWCSNCGDECSVCRYNCYKGKYCSSCDRNYPKECICCPNCDLLLIFGNVYKSYK